MPIKMSALYERLEMLRTELSHQHLDGFIVPSRGIFGSLDADPSSARLKFLTGFDGGDATAVLLPQTAALFTSTRSASATRLLLESGAYEVYVEPQFPHEHAIWSRVRTNTSIGFDPTLHSDHEISTLRRSLRARGKNIVLIPTSGNPIDKIWKNRSKARHASLSQVDLSVAKETSFSKRVRMKDALLSHKCHIAILSNPTSIAWLLNISGKSGTSMPVADCHAILHDTGTVDLFIETDQASSAALGSLRSDVQILSPDTFRHHLQELGHLQARALLDRKTTSYAIVDALEHCGAEVVDGADPCILGAATRSNGFDVCLPQRTQKPDAPTTAASPSTREKFIPK